MSDRRRSAVSNLKPVRRDKWISTTAVDIFLSNPHVLNSSGKGYSIGLEEERTIARRIKREVYRKEKRYE